MSNDPIAIFEKLEDGEFTSIEQFNDLVRASAHYYQQYGPLDMLKLYIPNNNKDPIHSYLNVWTPELANTAADDVIRVFSKQYICDSYLKEIKEDGVYLAFTIVEGQYLSKFKYWDLASWIIKKGKKNGIHLTAEEWLHDFPYERHAAFHNRAAASKEISIWVRKEENKLYAKAIYDGRQNWLERDPSPKIQNWIPQGTFTTNHIWKFQSTLQEDMDQLAKFKEDFK